MTSRQEAMMVVNADSHNVSGSVLEMEPAAWALKDETHEQSPTDKQSPTKTKTSCCTGLKAFLAALGFVYFSKVFTGAIMKSSITQLERRFDISSSQAGFLDGGFELGNLLVIAFVSYFGAKLHRPKVIAAGCIIMSMGSFLTALPHFFMGSYNYDTLSRLSDKPTSSISPCSMNQSTTEIERNSKLDCEKGDSLSYMWIYVLMGNILRGIGETPISPLGISYLDDFSRSEDSPFYIGCLHTVAMIGPMFGYLLGSLCARLYVDIGFVDLSTVTITPTDSRWVGAWWLGFLVGGVLMLVSAIPFTFLPKSLNTEGGQRTSVKTERNIVKMNGDERQLQKSENQQTTEGTGNLKDFFKALKKVLGNQMYFVLLCVSLLHFSSFIGFLTYSPKYLEQQYGQSTSQSNFFTGIAILPATCLGIFLGGLIMKKYKFGIITTTKLAFGSSFVAFCFSLLYFVVGCDDRTVAGFTVPYDGQPGSWAAQSLSSACNAACNCTTSQWDPVCGGNGITYVSACFAGCKDITGSGKSTVFHNCSCIENQDSQPRNFSASLGECPRSEDCSKNFIYFVVIKTLNAFANALGGVPYFMIFIRCIPQELKSLGVGLHMLVMRALAGIPAPVYFGAVIDMACLKWASKSCGRRGVCRLYNGTAYRHTFLGLAAVLKLAAFLLGFVFFWILKKHFGGKKLDSTENGRQEGTPFNEEVKPNGTTELGAVPLDSDQETCI